MARFVDYWVSPARLEPGQPVSIFLTDENRTLTTRYCLCSHAWDWDLAEPLRWREDRLSQGACSRDCPHWREIDYSLPEGSVRVCCLRLGTFNLREVLDLIKDIIQESGFSISAEELHISLLSRFSSLGLSDWLSDILETKPDLALA